MHCEISTILIDLKQIVDILVGVLTILAIVCGGIWTYFNFIHGRIYRPRLKLEIEAEVVNYKDTRCLRVTLRINNIGMSRVILLHEGSGLMLYSYKKKNYKSLIHSVLWDEEPYGFSVFEPHDWIESKETIEAKLLIAVPESDDLAWKLDLLISTHATAILRKKYIVWKFTQITWNQ